MTNLPQGISRGTRFPGRGTSFSPSDVITLEDSYWFSGSIYTLDFDCRSCKDRITFHPKVALDSKEELPFSSD